MIIRSVAMKTIFSIFILMILVQFTFAQYPETLSHYSLVNARDLDQDFLLFTQDTTTQILINPARAIVYNKNFIYTNFNNYDNTTNSSFLTRYNYVMDNSYVSSTGEKSVRYRGLFLYSATNFAYTNAISQPDFSIVSLFSAMGSKWLLNLSYDVFQSTGNDDESRADWYERINDKYYRSENQSRTDLIDISANYAYADVALSKIGNSDLGNYSLGIFASYKQDNCENTISSIYKDENISYSRYIKRDRHSLNDITEYNKSKANIYQFGVSYALNTEKFDYIGRVSYQQSDYKEYIISDEIIGSIDTTTHDTIPEYLIINKSNILEDFNLISKYKPGSYQFYSYLQHNVNWFKDDDHLFLKVNGFYSSDEKTFNSNSRAILSQSYYNFEDGYEFNQDTLDVITDDNSQLDNWAIGLSLGYIISYHLSDLTFMTALNPKYQIIHLEDGGANSYVLNSETELKEIAIKVPFYICYSPAKWIDIYGGLNYQYSIGWLNQDYEYIFKQIYSGDQIQNRINELSRDIKSIQSLKDSYLGVNLKHRSGLRCMIYFGSNITYHKTWNISLGYHF